MRRVAWVVGIRPEAIEEYERIHADVWPEVLAALTAANVTNYSIYRYGNLLFSYFEYLGDDLEEDFKKVTNDPTSQKWNAWTSTMQLPPEGADPDALWMDIPEVFHLA